MATIANMASDNLNIEVLVKWMARGDEQAYRKLVLQYSDLVYAYCLKFAKNPYYAEELTQEVFIKLWTYRQQLVHVQSWDRYLYKIAKNTAFRFMLKVAKEEKLQQEILQHFSGLNNTAEPDINDRLIKTRQAIQALPQRRQQAFTMSRLEGLTHREIAEELNISPNTVKEHIVQATKAIRKYLNIRPDLGAIVLLWRFLS